MEEIHASMEQVSIEMKVMSKARATSKGRAASPKGGSRKGRQEGRHSSEAREATYENSAPKDERFLLSRSSPIAASKQVLTRWSSPAGMAEVLVRSALQLPSQPIVLFADGV